MYLDLIGQYENIQKLRVLLEEWNKRTNELKAENRKLQAELKKKQKVIKYYRSENKRLKDLVDKLHVDCVYYENHWMPKPGENKDTDFMF